MPSDATYIFTQADGPRATPATELAEGFSALHPSTQVYIVPDRFEAYQLALALSGDSEAREKNVPPAAQERGDRLRWGERSELFRCASRSELPASASNTANRTAIYIGGSTYILDCDKSR